MYLFKLKGLCITTGSLAPDAKHEAPGDGAPVTDLIDGETRCGRLKGLKPGVSTRQVEETTIDPDWFSMVSLGFQCVGAVWPRP